MPAQSTPRKRTMRPVATAPAETIDDADQISEREPVEFSVTFDRDGEEETHTFSARPRLTYKRMADAAKGQKSKGVEAILLFERLIRPALLDTDGTPSKWTVEPYDGMFVDPNGDERPLSELAEVEAFDAGSSRRRWLHIMDDDDELEVELEQITGVYEKLIEATSDRPTRRLRRS